MQVSAEIRWFWTGQGPCLLEAWFRDPKGHPVAPGGGHSRTDEYLRDEGQEQLGIKRRGGKKGIEVKGLVAELGEIRTAPFIGRVQLWTKWTSEALELTPAASVRTDKRRWLRTFAADGQVLVEVALDGSEKPVTGSPPARGCNVELAEVRIGSMWWTLGFESFGSLDTVEADLRAAAALVARERHPPSLDGWTPASYPRWLNEVLRRR
ncbi:MAG TPA: hypothetical protein VEK07_16070 [Polyangiaceae bacterium]|nr:hypothetical protein [Polyangiaceae bacterium]